MNRNNTVSVIEVAAESPNNSTNRSNPQTDRGNESELSVPLNDSLADLEPIETEKNVTPQEITAEVLNDKVEFKLKMRNILSCRICSELRRCPMYQCKYGHLICAGCLHDILAESRLQNEIASCPECQTTITKELCFRNVAVEKTISELPVTCPYCSLEFPPLNFKYHESAICDKRPAVCSNNIIGCPWQGPDNERAQHEQQCTQPSANGYEILKSLLSLDQQQKEGVDLYNKIMELLSVEKISYTDLQLKYHKTENKNIMFETSKFSAFENQWMLRACCVTDTSKDFNLSYQLIVKSKLISPMNLQYMILRGPYNEMEIRPKVYHFKFSEKAEESPYQTLDVPRNLDKECFSAKRINIRVIMFIVRSKKMNDWEKA